MRVVLVGGNFLGPNKKRFQTPSRHYAHLTPEDIQRVAKICLRPIRFANQKGLVFRKFGQDELRNVKLQRIGQQKFGSLSVGDEC